MPAHSEAGAPIPGPRRSLKKLKCTPTAPDQRKRDFPVADATRFRLFGKAKNDTIIVRRCPLCRFAHRHIAFEGTTGLFTRHPSCKPSQTYLVRVVETVPGIADISVMPAQRAAA